MTHLIADADFAVDMSRAATDRMDEGAASRFARMAVLLYGLSLEGFINFVYEYSRVPDERWRDLSFKDKWLNASSECLFHGGILETEKGIVYRPGDAVQRFQDNAEPFLSFLELKAIRNSVVHLKPQFNSVDVESIDAHVRREEYYPFSGLPKFLKDYRVEHAETAKRIYRQMTEELNLQMKGTILYLFETEGGVFVETVDEWQDEESLSNCGNQ